LRVPAGSPLIGILAPEPYLSTPELCRYVHESVWLMQRLMASLFGESVPTVNEHLANI